MNSHGSRARRSAYHRPRVFSFSPWLFIDSALWAIAITASIWLRYDFSASRFRESLAQPWFYFTLVSLVLTSLLIGWIVGLYRGRYIAGSLLETAVLASVFTAASLGVTLIVAVLHAIDLLESMPRSTPLVTGAFTILSALALRSVVRRRELFGAGSDANADPVIVFGAGDGGVQLVRQLRRSPNAQFRPLAILDDDSSKHQMVLEGVRVAGGRERIEETASRTGAVTLIIAVPSLPSDDLIDIRDRAEGCGLQVLVLPPLHSMMRGRIAADELREINVNDLLGRKPARLNQTQIAQYLRGKRILVTGAGGSIGSELCRQLSRFRPDELMMLDRDESGLHAVQLSISDQAMLDGDDTILASIRDESSIREIFHRRKPQIVFHAAALKHMPLLESYPLEALKTNVLGTFNLLEAAEAAGVETFVNISTDKAANPCSALGASKRIAERLTANRATKASGKYVSVRFGNVLGSRGSVLTVFEKQIKDGGPVTVTDPDVNRFFMTIPEACQLVLQASVVGESGETLVLDMGDPVRIADVARTLIEQSGRDIEVVYTGLRENEKLSEELFDDTERPIVGTKHESLSQVQVSPLRIEPRSVELIQTQECAREWLEKSTYGESSL